MKSKIKLIRAFTLIEIMISMAVILLVTALALPQVKDSMKSGTVSRSASLVQGAFRAARAMAIEKGKPFGVMIERRANEVSLKQESGYRPDNPSANYSARLSFVQVPANYPANDGITIPRAYPFSEVAAMPRNPNVQAVTYQYFVPGEDAELLMAACKDPESLAGRLIKPGTIIEVGVGESARRAKIEQLEYVLSLSQRLRDTAVNQVPNRFPFNSPGVAIKTEDWLIANPALKGSAPSDATPYVGVPLSIKLDPIRAAMAPLNLPGRTVVDLSVSGSRANPIAFNVEEIIGDRQVDQLGVHGVIVMFSPDGRVDSVYMDRRFDLDNQGNFEIRWERHAPPPSMSFLVGFSQGVLSDVDDGANHPYELNPRLSATELSFDPNFTNSDCHWVTLDTQSGRSDVVPVASQPEQDVMRTYFTDNELNDSRIIIKKRIDRSKRLSYGGVL